MRAFALLLAPLALASVLAGCRVDAGDCDRACRNVFQLHYWDKAEAEIAKLPEAEREAARRVKLMDLEERTNKGINVCVKQCQSAGNRTQVDCMLNAKTAAVAKECSE